MTPRCFAAWTEGKAKAAERASEDAVVTSWLTGLRVGEAMSGKLKPLDRVLAKIKPRKKRRQSADEMLAILLQFQAGGAPMNIRKLN